jgi:hypothetical protein
MAHFQKHPEVGVTHPSQVVIIGDRLMTDMMLANMMGSRGIWIRNGVAPLAEKSMVCLFLPTLPSSLSCFANHFLLSSSQNLNTEWLLSSLRVDLRHQTHLVPLSSQAFTQST